MYPEKIVLKCHNIILGKILLDFLVLFFYWIAKKTIFYKNLIF